MKRIALRWLGALLLSITLAAPALAAGKHLINGIDANYPPFAYVDETGKPAGFDVDSMNWINSISTRNTILMSLNGLTLDSVLSVGQTIQIG